ncbi:hypothetical protein F183_A28380 [Bryobacterales bacterium F-183]|nr:hypothetical protein F183_A28380 [Bryobacterales bacterium F-183]
MTRPTQYKLLILVAAGCLIAATSQHPGLRNIATKAYSPPVMDAQVFNNLWRSWDAESRSAAEKADARTRRQMIFDRYGFLEAPYDNGGVPLGLTVTKDGHYALNCLVCHAGSVGGKTILGLPSKAMDFSGLFEDMAATYSILHQGKPGNPPFPEGLLFLHGGKAPPKVEFPEGLLSGSRGNYNSFTFSVYFMAMRDRELSLAPKPQDLKPLNHYLDAPPLWNTAKKTALYYDGFVRKSVRPLMQFSLDPSFNGALFRSWEADYQQIYDWVNTLESPHYEGELNRTLAAQGEKVYTQTCQGCHGAAGRGGDYRNIVVPIDVVKTDRARLDGLSPEFKQHFNQSWMGSFGEAKIAPRAEGYVAPPLDGVWATAPYFHNGSVPTLYHVLFPDERPQVWKVTSYNAYDHTRAGLSIAEYGQMPNVNSLSEKRRYYDSSRPTMSNTGHRFADVLTRAQRISLLEYLKSI